MGLDRRVAAIHLLPAVVLCLPAWGPHRAAGMGTEMLWGRIFAGVQVRRWLEAGGWGRADALAGAPAWVPDGPLMAALQAGLGGLLDDGRAWTLLLAALLALAGLGPHALARARGAGPWSAVLAGLLVQLSPPVLRAAWSGEVGVLGVGPAALALAALAASRPAAGGLLALLAGAVGSAAAGLVAAGALLLRRPLGLLALLPVLALLAAPSSAAPGAARPTPVVPRTVPARVAEDLAALPVPPEERPAPPEPVGTPGLGLDRLPGGAGAWAASLLGLAVAASRGPALLALAAGGAWLTLLGPLPPRGLAPPVPPAWLEAAARWVPGLRPPVGTGDWLALMLLPAALAAARARGRAVLLVPVALAAWLENPRLRLPVTPTAPAPALSVLAGVPDGSVSVFPNPAPPWQQEGPRAAAELAVHAARAGRAAELGARPPADAALLGHLAHESGLPVDLSAGPALWAARGEDPVASARRAGVAALLVDRAALGPERFARVDAWLAARVGVPLAADERFAVYALAPGPRGTLGP